MKMVTEWLHVYVLYLGKKSFPIFNAFVVLMLLLLLCFQIKK